MQSSKSHNQSHPSIIPITCRWCDYRSASFRASSPAAATGTPPEDAKGCKPPPAYRTCHDPPNTPVSESRCPRCESSWKMTVAANDATQHEGQATRVMGRIPPTVRQHPCRKEKRSSSTEDEPPVPLIIIHPSVENHCRCQCKYLPVFHEVLSPKWRLMFLCIPYPSTQVLSWYVNEERCCASVEKARKLVNICARLDPKQPEVIEDPARGCPRVGEGPTARCIDIPITEMEGIFTTSYPVSRPIPPR